MKLSAALPVILGVALQVFGQQTDTAKFLAGLEEIPAQVDRINSFSADSLFRFDFNGEIGTTRTAGGNSTRATVSNFPALFKSSLSAAVIDLAPCGMNAPHTHPRASEMVYVIKGNISIAFIEENGARIVKNTVGPKQGSLLPKGSVHYQLNNECEPAKFISMFNDEDPGQIQFAQRIFGLPGDAVLAALGGTDIQDIVKIVESTPDNLAIGVDSCLKKCGLTRGAQTKNQAQPRGQYNPVAPS